jgi:hypothetical protein
MDPDETLTQIRTLITNYQTSAEEMSTSDAAELVFLVDELDEWLTKGGFLPTEWNALRSPLRTTSTENVTRVQRGGVGTRAGS